eukprot:TRINITY_DN2576_c0_g3_i4.p2 TRINITY_DN2576_c0_g3~~TRINITY_DN2576_c0_g3_i4.p2  ORF type:complete len:107 (-),score=27.10 TRINITY_DN2576_c0_g3_i4:119-439(-)
MIRRPPRSTHCISSAASDVYKRQVYDNLSNVVLSAKILNEAEYINEYVVDRGDDIKYDEASKTVTWNIGEIGRGDNVFGYFYIYLRPTTGDIGCLLYTSPSPRDQA